MAWCPHCGADNWDFHERCMKCGRLLREEESKEETTPVLGPKPVSAIGGYILILALLLLIGGWLWQEDLTHQAETGEYSGSVKDYYDSVKTASRIYNTGVVLMAIAGIVIAFTKVPNRE